MYSVTLSDGKSDVTIEYRLPLRAQYLAWKSKVESAVMPKSKRGDNCTLYDASKYLAQTCCTNKSPDELDELEETCFDLYDIMSEAIETSRQESQKKLK